MKIEPPILTVRLTIRALEDSDFPLIVDVARELPLIAELINGSFSEMVSKLYWKQVTQPNVVNGLIFLQDTQEFCGRICATFEDEAPELGITLLHHAQNRGIGPESVVAFANRLYQSSGIRQLKVLISPENTHSKHIFEKIGAVFVARRCPYNDVTLKRFREINLDTSKLEKNVALHYSLELPVQTDVRT